MNKPLTIEQLKSLEPGDWVWIVRNNEGCYYQVLKPFSNGQSLVIKISDDFNNESWEPLFYVNYNKEWLAYKNKEEANNSFTPSPQMMAENDCGGDCPNCEGISLCYKEQVEDNKDVYKKALMLAVSKLHETYNYFAACNGAELFVDEGNDISSLNVNYFIEKAKKLEEK